MEINQNNFLYTLTSIRQRLFNYLESELSKKNIHDIPPSYGDILFILDTKGPLTLQDIARYARKDKSTVSSVIKRLEKSGYIIKAKGKDDGRFVKIKLTSKAKKIKPIIWAISRDMNEQLFIGLNDEEKNNLFYMLGKIINNINSV